MDVTIDNANNVTINGAENVTVTGSGMEYVDRGNFAAHDFSKDDLVIDSNWQELDLSKLIPVGAKIVKLRIDAATTSSINSYFDMKPFGYVDNYNNYPNNIYKAAYHHGVVHEIPIGPDKKVVYRAHAVTWDFLDVNVQGWWL